MAGILIELLSISPKILGQWKEGLWLVNTGIITTLAINVLIKVASIDLGFLTLLLDKERIDALDVEHIL